MRPKTFFKNPQTVKFPSVKAQDFGYGLHLNEPLAVGLLSVAGSRWGNLGLPGRTNIAPSLRLI